MTGDECGCSRSRFEGAFLRGGLGLEARRPGERAVIEGFSWCKILRTFPFRMCYCFVLTLTLGSTLFLESHVVHPAKPPASEKAANLMLWGSILCNSNRRYLKTPGFKYKISFIHKRDFEIAPSVPSCAPRLHEARIPTVCQQRSICAPGFNIE